MLSAIARVPLVPRYKKCQPTLVGDFTQRLSSDSREFD
jgi:hypothetical protein